MALGHTSRLFIPHWLSNASMQERDNCATFVCTAVCDEYLAVPWQHQIAWKLCFKGVSLCLASMSKSIGILALVQQQNRVKVSVRLGLLLSYKYCNWQVLLVYDTDGTGAHKSTPLPYRRQILVLLLLLYDRRPLSKAYTIKYIALTLIRSCFIVLIWTIVFGHPTSLWWGWFKKNSANMTPNQYSASDRHKINTFHLQYYANILHLENSIHTHLYYA